MAESITIARPYAEALFKLAQEKKTLSSWSDMLSSMSAVVEQEQIKALIDNPQIPSVKLHEIILAVLGKKLTDDGERLVSLLIENSRLTILPDLKALYDQLRAQYESVLDAEIESAFSLESSQVNKLIAMLESKFNKKVNAQVRVNSDLIGGVRISIGDQVIDSSVNGKLKAMAAALKS